MENEENFIAGIHNYCDRWCERCEFTARCRLFEIDAEVLDDEKEFGNKAFFRSLTRILEDAHSTLLAKAEEFGINLDAANDPEILKSQSDNRKSVKSDRLTKLAEKYAFDAVPVLESKDTWLGNGANDDPATGEMLEILYWYHSFIAAKIQRGLSGILDFDCDEDWDELHDPQSDANGSAKVALIAIERSILAWTYIMSPENADQVRPFIALLEEIKLLAEQKFPNARGFLRPGFDEIGMVM